MKFLRLIFSVLIAQSAGVVGSIFTVSNVDGWYATLEKPLWNPPSWVFGPVWIALYTLMGISAYLVWRQRHRPGAKLALSVYGAHLVLNALWSILFFGLQNPGLAFAEILILLGSILVTTVLFWRINNWSGALLVPYLSWAAFATLLNFTIWQLN